MDQYLAVAGSVLGGLGLFLLAVSMITDGLKLATGEALTEILGRWTRTTGHGILSGLTITSLVQSSSAVTVATIGFVNAGLLSMPQALGVIYGANIGTTMTGWLVAVVGFKIKIELFALPLLGLGMLLKLSRPKHLIGSIGIAMAGFGLFFVGIDILKNAFESIAAQTNFHSLDTESAWSLLIFLWVGFLITVLTQSSSAAIALILTATTGGIVPFDAAAAMVIGANVGTTSTAVLSVIGATSNAKRVAVAHIFFNLGTGIIALLVLPILLWFIHTLGETFNLTDAPVITLALFHTIFNILGVIVFWPATRRLASFLLKRFQTTEEKESRPKYLDKTTLATPSLAISALVLELRHISKITRRMAAGAISTEVATSQQLETDYTIVTSLLQQAEQFSGKLHKLELTDKNVADLNSTYKASRYLLAASELSFRIAKDQVITRPIAGTELAVLVSEYDSDLVDYLFNSSGAVNEERLENLKGEYKKLSLKNEALRLKFKEAGIHSKVSLKQLTHALDFLGRCQRLSKNVFKFYQVINLLAKDEHILLVKSQITNGA